MDTVLYKVLPVRMVQFDVQTELITWSMYIFCQLHHGPALEFAQSVQGLDHTACAYQSTMLIARAKYDLGIKWSSVANIYRPLDPTLNPIYPL